MPLARLFFSGCYKWLLRSKFFLLASLLVTLFSMLAVNFLPGLQRFNPLFEAAQLTSQAQETQQVQNIVLIVFDEPSIQSLDYRQPIDRAAIAKVLQHIQLGNPKAVGITVDLKGSTELHKDKALNLTLKSFESDIFIPLSAVGGAAGKQQNNPVLKGLAENRFVRVLPEVNANQVASFMLDDSVQGVYSMAFALHNQSKQNEPSHAPRYLNLMRSIDGWQTPFIRYSANDVKTIPAKWFENKWVLIGQDTLDSDRVELPWAFWVDEAPPTVSLVDYHALSLLTLENGITFQPISNVILFFFLFLVAYIALYVGWYIALKRWRFVLLGGAALVWLFLVDLFQAQHILMPWFVFIVVLSLGLAVGWVNRKKLYLQQLKFIRSIHSAYLSFELKTRLYSNPEALKRTDDKKELAILSVRWPTPVGLQAQRAVRLELRRLCLLIADFSGYVITTHSDQIIAVFNTPVQLPQYKMRAMACALQVLTSLNIPRIQNIKAHPLQQPKVLVVAGKGSSSPRQIMQPGGFWVAGQAWADFKRFQALHNQFDDELIINDAMLDSLRDPNWQAEPIEPQNDTKLVKPLEAKQLFRVMEKQNGLVS